MHLNSVVLIGRCSPKGPSLRYADSGVAACSFVLEVDEHANGKVFTTWIPVEVTGRFAETTAAELEPGDVVQVQGRWKYRSTVDGKSGAKVSKPVVSTWGIAQRLPAESPHVERSPDAQGDESSDDRLIAPRGADETIPVKARSRRQMYAKLPGHVN